MVWAGHVPARFLFTLTQALNEVLKRNMQSALQREPVPKTKAKVPKRQGPPTKLVGRRHWTVCANNVEWSCLQQYCRNKTPKVRPSSATVNWQYRHQAAAHPTMSLSF